MRRKASKHLFNMPYYTFIMDYMGGTYIPQVKASSHKTAFIKGATALKENRIEGLGVRTKALLIEKLTAEESAPVIGVENVWCHTALVRGRLALITLVQTER